MPSDSIYWKIVRLDKNYNSKRKKTDQTIPDESTHTSGQANSTLAVVKASATCQTSAPACLQLWFIIDSDLLCTNVIVSITKASMVTFTLVLNGADEESVNVDVFEDDTGIVLVASHVPVELHLQWQVCST